MVSPFTFIASLFTLAALANGFSFAGQKAPATVGYVPDGLSAAEYARIKKTERVTNKNLGHIGPQGFKSRSMQAWQEAYEKGKASHAFAPFGYRQAYHEGRIKKQDIPYMVRGGNWDNSDVVGARKLAWNKRDRQYAAGGFRKEQSASILGSGPGFDWTGTQDRTAPRRLIPGLS